MCYEVCKCVLRLSFFSQFLYSQSLEPYTVFLPNLVDFIKKKNRKQTHNTSWDFEGPHHFIALWQYCLSTEDAEDAKLSIFLVLWGFWCAAWKSVRESICDSTGTALEKCSPEHGDARLWTSTMLPGTQSPSVIPSSIILLPCGSQSQKEMERSGTAIRRTEKLLSFR